MSQAVVWGRFTCKLVNFGLDEQTKQALDRIDRLLKSFGSDKSKILSTQIWLTDIGDFETMNAYGRTYCPLVQRRHATCQTTLADFMGITVVAAL